MQMNGEVYSSAFCSSHRPIARLLLRRGLRERCPRQSSSFNEELFEIFGVPKRFKYRTLEPLGDVDLLFCSVVKSRSDDEAAHVFSSDYLWQITHVASKAALVGPHCLHHRVRSGILPGVSYREASRNPSTLRLQ